MKEFDCELSLPFLECLSVSKITPTSLSIATLNALFSACSKEEPSPSTCYCKCEGRSKDK